MTPPDDPFNRIINRLESVVDRVSSLAERLATMEAVIRGQAERHEHFWERDWPEVISRLQRLEGRLDHYHDQVGKLEAAMATQSALCETYGKQAAGGGAMARMPIYGGAAGGAALVAEVLRLMGVF